MRNGTSILEVQNEDQGERCVEERRRKETIFVLLIFLGIIAFTIAGSWYLLQPRTQEHEGVLASDLSLTSLDGNTFRLSDFRGKVVIINFMASWCGYCRQEMPHLKVIWEKENYSDKIVLMSIDIDPLESEEELRAYAKGFPYATWIWARDTANLAQEYQVPPIPKTVIIDQHGYVRFTYTGVTDASTFIEKIDHMLGQNHG